MKYRRASVISGTILAFLLMALWLMTGCDEAKSPVTPEEGHNLAPDGGKAIKDAQANDSIAKPKPKGKAKGNPHTGGEPPEQVTGRRGNVKMPLLDILGFSIGWAMANTTTDYDDDNNAIGTLAVDEPADAPINTLIIKVHLKDGEPYTEFDVKVIFADDETDGSTDHIFEDAISTNRNGKGNSWNTIILADGYTSPIYVRIQVGHASAGAGFDVWYDTANDENVMTAVELKN